MAVLIGWDPATPLPPHLSSFTRALLVSQDRQHLFVTPCLFQKNVHRMFKYPYIFRNQEVRIMCGGGLNCPVMAGTDYWMENYSLLVGNFEADSHLILIRLTAAHTHSLPSSHKSHHTTIKHRSFIFCKANGMQKRLKRAFVNFDQCSSCSCHFNY